MCLDFAMLMLIGSEHESALKTDRIVPEQLRLCVGAS